jgi:hypothetical protein
MKSDDDDDDDDDDDEGGNGEDYHHDYTMRRHLMVYAPGRTTIYRTEVCDCFSIILSSTYGVTFTLH